MPDSGESPGLKVIQGRLRLISAETEVHPGITVYPVGGQAQ